MADIGSSYARLARYSADLCLFLLVAEMGQMSRAAEAAGLSQPRLSQRMKSLEDSLGRALLVRQRSGVRLTPAGRELQRSLLPHVDPAAEAFARFQARPRRRTVVIETDLAFASFRFLPVFPALCAAFPDLSLSLLTRQLPHDDSAPEADLRIRMEPITPDTPRQRLLFPEQVVAVCSPAFRAAHPAMDDPAQLAALPLIELATDSAPPWFTWTAWFRALGHDRPLHTGDLCFSSYDHVIQSAERGLGIALGWRGLIDSRLEDGALIPALPQEAQSQRGYILSLRPRDPDAATRAVFDWVAQNFTRA